MGHPHFFNWLIMLNEASHLNETSEAIAVNNSSQQSVQVYWGCGVTDGEIVIECADSKDFTGMWAELERLPCIGENRLYLYEHNGPCVFIRTRVSREIIGGTVTTKLQCLVG